MYRCIFIFVHNALFLRTLCIEMQRKCAVTHHTIIQLLCVYRSVLYVPARKKRPYQDHKINNYITAQNVVRVHAFLKINCFQPFDILQILKGWFQVCSGCIAPSCVFPGAGLVSTPYCLLSFGAPLFQVCQN